MLYFYWGKNKQRTLEMTSILSVAKKNDGGKEFIMRSSCFVLLQCSNNNFCKHTGSANLSSEFLFSLNS